MNQSEKQKKQAKDYDAEAKLELEGIKFNAQDLVGNVASTLSKNVQRAQNEDIKKQFITKFHSALGKFSVANVQQELLAKLTNEQLPIFFDYVNYSFELLSKGYKLTDASNSYSSTFLLQVYNKLVDLKGLPIIIESISQKKTLPTQIITIK